MIELPLEVVQALSLTFPKPITGFLTDAAFDAPVMRGLIYCDVDGRPDGTAITTSPVSDFGTFEGFGVVRTVDGHLYVVAKNLPNKPRPTLETLDDDPR